MTFDTKIFSDSYSLQQTILHSLHLSYH